jgi:Domain of unknown function (DUF397)
MPTLGWRKASFSVNNGQCVEIASARAAVLVRDSADPVSPVISYPARTWREFLIGAQVGTYGVTR